MSFKKVSLVLFVFVSLSSAQKSISSVEQQLQKIENSLDSREMILRDTIKQLQAKVDLAMASSALSSSVIAELEKLKALLADLVTVGSYASKNTSLNCNNVAEVSSKVLFTIKQCVSTNIDIVGNRTKLAVVFGCLNSQYAINYYRLTTQQQQDVKAVITFLYIALDVKS